MSFDVQKVFEASIEGGREITPVALSTAIRAAAMQCRDSSGNISIARLYELTCELESLTIDTYKF